MLPYRTQDHIQEIIDKWLAIDDEIWAKIICMERNRRIAKAYARKHALVVNGSEDEYLDGTTLGLNSFDNPDRDIKTRHIKQYIGHGLRIKIAQSGDILARRLSRANVYVHQFNNLKQGYSSSFSSDHLKGSNSSSDPYALNSESGDLYGIVGPTHRSVPCVNSNTGGFSISSSFNGFNSPHPATTKGSGNKQQQQHGRIEEHKLSSNVSSSSGSSSNGGTKYSNGSAKLNDNNNLLEYNKPVKIFDMNKFKELLAHESRQPCPNRKFLQNQCITVISFVVDDQKMLNLPSWVMIINIVAIDLLKNELGFMEPSELLHGTDPLLDRRRFAQHDQHHHLALPNGQTDLNLPRLESDNDATTNQNQLAASKKAFANAAALGAYNGDHYTKGTGSSANGSHYIQQQRPNNSRPRRYNNNDKMEKTCADSDGELNSTKDSNKQTKSSGSEVQQSSASSGFNSHCSSQHDSSAASSNSNIASGVRGGDDELSNDTNGQSKKAQLGSTNSSLAKAPIYKLLARSNNDGVCKTGAAVKSCPNLVVSTRGKRPPKLPHRLAQPKMSDPIPIPAPPTSAGAGPSGKANLILVSPTGLSPPLPKRKGFGQLSTGKLTITHSELNHLADIQEPEFSTIKHIDENGQCSVYTMSEAANLAEPTHQMNKLPAGIPAHAQLAPPATQRHILRYLMLTTRNKLNNLNNRPAHNPPPPSSTHHIHPQIPLPPFRYQRPLPVLPPTHRMKVNRFGISPREQQQQDESLYYCGLQARVPAQRVQQHKSRLNVGLPSNPVVSKSAINAILTDFRFNQTNQQQQALHFNQHLSRRQLYDLSTNTQDFSSKKQQKAVTNHHKGSNSGSRMPLMKFFRSSKSVERPRDTKKISPLNNQSGESVITCGN